MTREWEHSKFQHQAASRMQDALNALTRHGVPSNVPSYIKMDRVLNEYRLKIGIRIPRPVTFLLKLIGLSRGVLRLFHDGDMGFLVELREFEGAIPHYRHISDDMGAKIVKEGLTHDEFEALMTPDSFVEA